MTAATILEVIQLSKHFGGLVANDDINLSIDQGEIHGLIGPNGAGKTTLFNCIAGYFRPTSGKILFKGKNIVGLRPSRVCRLGIARTFQVTRPLKELTVLENIMIGAFARVNVAREASEKAVKVLEKVGLASKADARIGQLTVGDLRRLEIARAWATEPELLLLDEAMAGLTATETGEAVAMVREIQKSGVTIFMIEHVMDVIKLLADRITVLDGGKKLTEGKPVEVLQNPDVIRAYLGKAETDFITM